VPIHFYDLLLSPRDLMLCGCNQFSQKHPTLGHVAAEYDHCFIIKILFCPQKYK